MDTATICVILSIAAGTILFLVQSGGRRRLPPWPYPFPIIGNMLQLGRYPHRYLADLSKTYGPMLSVKVGRDYLVVVSSPELARKLVTQHDQAISARSVPTSAKAWDHDKYAMGLLPVGSLWRKLRKITKNQLFLAIKLEGSQGLRQEKLRQLHKHLRDCCAAGRAVDIGEVVHTTVLNQMSETLFSRDFGDFGSDSIRRLKDIIEDVIQSYIRPNFADLFPFLKGIDLQGISRRAKLSAGRAFAILEDVIEMRLSSRSGFDRVYSELGYDGIDAQPRKKSNLER
ncbi:ferruginol synthase-like isoform X2 [Andrographis paniculata]|uniref:ferruginol synthase-like isoform X2 n=1 Tax=Andrographis paniculata TaxID=175694 RepID=UPI0021E99E66|nr:ferruginol synthase-like isoform X2 [Andrographis paniculata]